MLKSSASMESKALRRCLLECETMATAAEEGLSVEKPEEINELSELRKRVRRLEKALADANIDLAMERSYTQMACQQAGIEDVAAFKKRPNCSSAPSYRAGSGRVGAERQLLVPAGRNRNDPGGGRD